MTKNPYCITTLHFTKYCSPEDCKVCKSYATGNGRESWQSSSWAFAKIFVHGTVIKDKRKHHGTVNKLSLDQRFHTQMVSSFAVWKTEAVALSATRSYGRQAGEQNAARFKIFKIIYWNKHWNFSTIQKGIVWL